MMKSWIRIPAGSHFSLANLPFGIITTAHHCSPHIAVAIGDHALDINIFSSRGGFTKCPDIENAHIAIFQEATLNSFAALGRPVHRKVRKYLQDVFREDTPLADILKNNKTLQNEVLVPLSEARNLLPMAIADYTDFFAGRNHAQTVGSIFRGPANALNPNYNHIPVAYHGRASSVVVSGTPLHRPRGQVLQTPGDTTPVFRSCAKLDMELELGMFVCRGNELGRPVDIDDAEEHIFGYVLMNDWSARDIQQWEYVPLGPFNAKNFGTTISPWVVLADALETHKTAGLPVQIELQEYLKEKKNDNVLDINLEVSLVSK